MAPARAVDRTAAPMSSTSLIAVKEDMFDWGLRARGDGGGFRRFSYLFSVVVGRLRRLGVCREEGTAQGHPLLMYSRR